MRIAFGILVAVVLAGGGLVLVARREPDGIITNFSWGARTREARLLAERIRAAEERSGDVRGVYMTTVVANDRGRAATRLRKGILELLDETEVNGVVIDVKEVDGGLVITDELRGLIRELHGEGVWVIARQVVFKDSWQEREHPEWYLRRKNGSIWRDNRGGSWLDPASRDVWAYQLNAAKSASDAGFDEIQFDYVRFPSDGNIADIVYPVYDGLRPRYEVMRSFFSYLGDELGAYRPELILSADLFGYVAIHEADLGIGQRLRDIGESFDYVSLMAYPSHYYGGFEVPADPGRNLPALFFPYHAADVSRTAVAHPHDVVYRSLLIAEDILSGRATTTNTVATSTPPASPTEEGKRRAKLRPWLQDFDLGVDSSRGIRYDAAKVRAEIDAAEAAGASGWLLWSPDNVYTREALKPE